ncbi:MAG: DNA alkylation repair protein [Salinivirgaceae bacterium]|nr:DNA alkylation repair protein [Salinivirgaceae bacterium]
MTFEDAFKSLRNFGTEQNRIIYRRHGANDPLFGVSHSNLQHLKKKIKRNHLLALMLWDTKVLDAQCLAALIADPKQISYNQALEWIKQSSYYVLTDMLVQNLVYKTKSAQRIMHELILSKEEYIGRAGWKLLEQFASDNNTLSDAYFIPYLQCIQSEINSYPNRIKEAMNQALIAIGCRNDNLEKICLTISKEIGKVYIDHGKTSCKTPNAAEYIVNCREKKLQKIVLYSNTNNSLK